MYNLESNQKYEYGCYVQVKNATPYITWRGQDFNDVRRFVEEIEHRHKRYRQQFYIDNKFYNNKFSNNNYVYYYRFLRRKINKWETV